MINVHLLIDAIVRQTTILVAQLATSGGARAGLGHTANQVFLELTTELRRQGLNNKLIADLFGMSLRTYHNNVRRISESSTDRGRPLWNAVLDFLQERGVATRGEVLLRFCEDDDSTVKSVLNDLVETGIVFAKGRGDSLAYRAADAGELRLGRSVEEASSREYLVWILVARNSPIARAALLELSQLDAAVLDASLEPLKADGRVREECRSDGVNYLSDGCVLPYLPGAGWEASVFDHYQAMVTALCAKLGLIGAESNMVQHIGGSTYSFDVWNDHPLRHEALGLLARFRHQASDLRSRIDQLNEKLPRPNSGVQRVVAYFGQNVLADSTAEMEKES